MKAQSPENPFLNILINIILPVMILNKGGQYLDARWTLLAALALPLIYGVQDYIRRRHKNYVSLLGLVNISLTGGLAMMNLHGIWFAVKEASLPLLLGLMVLVSAWTRNPAARMMFCNPQVLHIDMIEERIRAQKRDADFISLLKRTTLWLSLSFFISAALNFILALRIFSQIDPALDAAARDQIVNSQIAEMTWMGFAVIALPLMIFSGALVYAFLKKLSQMTGEEIHALIKS